MKLYVGNLPSTFSEQDLQDLFKSFGVILSAKVIIDRETGRSKGFGFVEFDSKESGTKAIEKMHNKEVGEKKIIVNEARPLQERNRFGGPGGGRPRGPSQDRGGRGENRFSNKRYSSS